MSYFSWARFAEIKERQLALEEEQTELLRKILKELKRTKFK